VNDGQSNVLLRNDLAPGSHWLAFDLTGVISNRSAIGARVTLVSDGRRQIQEVSGGSGYMSQNSLTIEFGLGTATMADSVIVAWPSGYVEGYAHVTAGQRLTLREMDGTPVEDGQAPGPAFRLTSGTPNPIRDAASLRYAIPVASHVRLAVYAVDGRLVTTLVDGIEPAGWHSVSWDRRTSRGARVAAGVYVAKLESLHRIGTHKLALLP
jgi:hypothetical protein